MRNHIPYFFIHLLINLLVMKEKELHIDGIDKKILKHLMTDARTPILSISRDIGISGAAIHQRLRKLESSGLIAGSKFIINPKVLGYKTLAFVGIFLDSASKYTAAVRRLKEIPEVIESHYTTGNYNMFVRIHCRNTNHLKDLLHDKIQPIEGIVRTETIISLEESLNRNVNLKALLKDSD